MHSEYDNQFQLYKTDKPTGDPDCPWEVREAKRIERAIGEQFLVTDMEHHSDDDMDTIDHEEPPLNRPRVSYRISSVANRLEDTSGPSVRRRGGEINTLVQHLAHQLDPKQDAIRKAESDASQVNRQMMIMLQSQLQELRRDLRAADRRAQDSERRAQQSERRAYELQSELNLVRMQLFMATTGAGGASSSRSRSFRSAEALSRHDHHTIPTFSSSPFANSLNAVVDPPPSGSGPLGTVNSEDESQGDSTGTIHLDEHEWPTTP